MTTSQNQIKKINDMWANGERNKSAIMKAVGVSRKTLLKHLNQQVPVQQITPSESAKTVQERKPMQMQQPVKDTQSPDQLTNETYHHRKWTWEEVAEYTRPDPEPVFHDPRLDNLGPLPGEPEQQIQSLYYQYPEEDPQYNWIKDEMTEIKEKLIKWEEEDRRKSEEIARNRETQQSQIKNEHADTQNLQLQQQNIEPDPNKSTPVIEKDEPVLSSVDSTSPKPEETKNQNIYTSFTPTTKINFTKPEGKHQTAEANSEEPMPLTIEKEKKKQEETVIKTASKEYNISEIATSKNDTNNLQDRQNAGVTSAVALKETVPMEEKEETEQDYFEIPLEPLVTFLVNLGAGLIRSHWDKHQIKIQPIEQREIKNLSDYQNISNHKPIVHQPVVKKDNKKHGQQNYTVSYFINW